MIWTLWSGMFLCLLAPAVEASHLSSPSEQTVIKDVMDAEVMLSHCLEITDDPEGLTCKSDVNGPIALSDLAHVAAINSALLFSPFELVDSVVHVVGSDDSEPIQFVYLYLLFCSFLK